MFRNDLVPSADQTAEIARAMREASMAPRYVYPWEGLEDALRGTGSEHLPCVGYGSLVNAESASQTLGPGKRVPVVAFGVRRLFNYEIDERVSRYGPPVTPRSRGALNVVVTGNPEDAINGILLSVHSGDIRAFRLREKGYDLVPVATIPWERREEHPTIAYILQCPDEPRDGRVRTRHDVQPHLAYYKACRDGAASFGEEFLRFWLATTYLADGVTPVAGWETGGLAEGGIHAAGP